MAPKGPGAVPPVRRVGRGPLPVQGGGVPRRRVFFGYGAPPADDPRRALVLRPQWMASAKAWMPYNRRRRVLVGQGRLFGQCLACRRVFRRPRNYELHVERLCRDGVAPRLPQAVAVGAAALLPEHGEDPRALFQCVARGCFKYYRSKLGMRNHFQQVHARDASVRCDECEEYFSSKQALKQHIAAIHEDAEKEHQCGWCLRYFRTKQSLKRHEDGVHFRERPHVCWLCNKAFKEKGTLEAHEDAIHRKLRFGCLEEGCKASYSAKTDLRRHMRSKHLGVRVACTWGDCERTFSERGSMLKHIRSVHRGERVQCSWPDCERTFAFRSGMQQHIRSWHRLEGHLCSWTGCRYDATQKGHVRQHIRSVHEKVRYPCPVPTCDKDYSEPSNRTAHIKKAHDEAALSLPRRAVGVRRKPRAKCPQCGKWYPTARLLAGHLAAAHGLQRHARLCLCGKMHMTRREYRCCLWSHIEKPSTIAPLLGRMHPCDFCLRIFRSSTALAAHVSLKHR